MDPATLAAGSQIVNGLSGIFKKRAKKTPLQTASEKLSLEQIMAQQKALPAQTQLMMKLLDEASKYDPGTATLNLRNRIEAAGQRNADIGQREVLAQVARGGGVLGGDTQITALRQRSLDNAWNPVGTSLAQIEAAQPEQTQRLRMNALQGAAGNAGNFANQVSFGALNAPQIPDDPSPYMNLSQGIQGIFDMQGAAKRKRTLEEAGRVGRGVARSFG